MRRPILTKATCQQAAGGTGGFLIAILVIGVISRVVLSAGNDDGGSGGSYSGGYAASEYNWEYDVTIGEIADPWVPESEDDADPAGSRLVAIEVIIAASEENGSAYPTGMYDFSLIDNEEFVYAALPVGAEPMFPAEVDLEPGEKIWGWVTFEVAGSAGLDTLKSFEKTVSLRDRVAAAR